MVKDVLLPPPMRCHASTSSAIARSRALSSSKRGLPSQRWRSSTTHCKAVQAEVMHAMAELSVVQARLDESDVTKTMLNKKLREQSRNSRL
eukprot:6333550-Amphidinium_carterae.1